MDAVKVITKSLKESIQLPFSKSESNRALIIQSLCNDRFKIENLSNADDTIQLKKLLASKDPILNAGSGGTTFRFLLSYLALKGEENILSGDARLNQRPVKELVEALNFLGADISYVERQDFPPLSIKKGTFGKINLVTIDAGVSSQFISSLLLIAAADSGNSKGYFPEGLSIHLKGRIISASYIEMTLKMMRHFGVESAFENNSITIKPQSYKPVDIKISADWSAASYVYEAAVLADEAKLFLNGLNQNSVQGDEIISQLMMPFGIKTTFNNDGAWIEKVSQPLIEFFEYDFISCPDLAQTMAFICAALGIEASLTGLESLPSKETNRIEAIKNEISKLGTYVETTGNSIHIFKNKEMNYSGQIFNTYKDHRMAMSIAPLVLTFKEIFLDDAGVVSKSFPAFWEEMKFLKKSQV